MTKIPPVSPPQFPDTEANSPIMMILRLLSELESSRESDALTDMAAKAAGCNPELFKLPPAMLAEQLSSNEDISSPLLVIAGLSGICRNDSPKSLPDLTNICIARRTILRHFILRPAELVTAAPLNDDGELIGRTFTAKSRVSAVSNMPLRQLIRFSRDTGAKRLILAHNHPDEKAEPSAEDIRATFNLKETLLKHGITLEDHMIVSGIDIFSMRQSPKYRDFFGSEGFYREKVKGENDA